jgi:hypothetical protein
VLLIAFLVVVVLIVGIAFSQFGSAQANATRNVIGQKLQGPYGAYSQQEYPIGSGQYGNPHGHSGSMGMGMWDRRVINLNLSFLFFFVVF